MSIVAKAVDLLKDAGTSLKSNLAFGSIKGLSDDVLRREATMLEQASSTLKSFQDAGTPEMMNSDAIKSQINSIAKQTKYKPKNADDILKAEDVLGHVNQRRESLTQATASGKSMSSAMADYKYGDSKFKGIKGIGAQAKEYYWAGATTAQKATRIGATVGAYAGVNAMGRGLASYGTNNDGERDIAGIPGF